MIIEKQSIIAMTTRCVNGFFFLYSCRKQRYLLNISLTFAHIPYVFYIAITFLRYIYFNIIFLRYANDLLLKVISLLLTYGLYILTSRFVFIFDFYSNDKKEICLDYHIYHEAYLNMHYRI